MAASLITEEQFREVLRLGMPSANAMNLDVLSLERGHAVFRMTTKPADLRPGETVAGPVLFGFADLALYAAVMSTVGVVPLAVTTDATIHFLRRPRAGKLVARAHILKEGARLVIGNVTISNDDEAPVVHGVMTYSIPPSEKSP